MHGALKLVSMSQARQEVVVEQPVIIDGEEIVVETVACEECSVRSDPSIRKAFLCVDVFERLAAHSVERMLFFGGKSKLGSMPFFAESTKAILEEKVAEEFPPVTEIDAILDGDKAVTCKFGNMNRLTNVTIGPLAYFFFNPVFFEFSKDVLRDRWRSGKLWADVEPRHVEVATLEFTTTAARAQVVATDFHGLLL